MIIVEFYDRKYNFKTKVEKIFDLRINKEIDDVWSATFKISNRENIWKDDILVTWKIIIKRYLEWNISVLFEWYIDNFSQDIKSTHIFCKENLWILENIKLKKNRNSAWNWILHFITEEFKKTEIWLDLKIVWWDRTTPIKWWIWEDLLSVFKRAIKWYYNIYSLWKEIIVSNKMSLDRTKGKEKIELYYIEKWNLVETNIRNFKLINSIEQIKNRIISHNWRNSSDYTDRKSIEKYWYFDSPFRIPRDSESYPQREIESELSELIEIKTDKFMFEKINIWDKIKLFIDIWDSFINIDSNVKVVWKSTIENENIAVFIVTRTNSNIISIDKKIKKIEKDINFISWEYS